jgi:hypothetical protein
MSDFKNEYNKLWKSNIDINTIDFQGTVNKDEINTKILKLSESKINFIKKNGVKYNKVKPLEQIDIGLQINMFN